MKRLIVILLSLHLFSCNYLNVKKTSTEEILNEELQTFNWNEVDEYPTFSACDSIDSKVEKQECFYKKISKHIATHLENQHFVVVNTVEDTIRLTFTISENGNPTITALEISDATLNELPEIKSQLINSITTLPEIYPALKRGQQVKTEFILPIIVKVD